MKKPVLCIDFDGVIHDKNEPIEGARAAVRYLQGKYRIVVLTARTEFDFVREWLNSQKIPYDEVTNVKPVAVAYIDDKAIRFEDWPKIRRIL